MLDFINSAPAQLFIVIIWLHVSALYIGLAAQGKVNRYYTLVMFLSALFITFNASKLLGWL